MELAGAYGKILYTGVFYRNPKPPPTLGTLIAKLQRFPAVRDEEAISSA
jgi:hypothetical protein